VLTRPLVLQRMFRLAACVSFDSLLNGSLSLDEAMKAAYPDVFLLQAVREFPNGSVLLKCRDCDDLLQWAVVVEGSLDTPALEEIAGVASYRERFLRLPESFEPLKVGNYNLSLRLLTPDMKNKLSTY
jgi:hypothetical protein